MATVPGGTKMPDDPVLEEYKILQSKLDKATDYRFTIRGWSATIILGLLLGGTAADAPNYILLFPLPVVVLFFLMEEQQNEVQNTLMRRALSLERILQEAGNRTFKDPNPYADPLGPVPGIATALNRSGRQAKGRKRWAQRSATLFYSVQAALIMIAFFIAFSHPAKKKEQSQSVYNFNSAEVSQATERKDGKPENQRSKEIGSAQQRQNKPEEAERNH